MHWCDYPQADAALIDRELEARMAIVRRVAALGSQAQIELDDLGRAGADQEQRADLGAARQQLLAAQRTALGQT